LAVDSGVIGRVSGRRVVAVERAPVSTFAQAVKDGDRVYQDRRAAQAAGFSDIPAPTGSNPMWEVMGKLGPGLILHGEQEFTYHRPVVVGDVLRGEDVIVEVYERESDTHVMTFIVTDTTWTDASSGDVVVVTRFNLIHRARKPS
jgi:acyl dehydratase